jgi:hypothetical protein
MFTTPASQGMHPPMPARSAAPRLRRLAGILAGLAAFFLACGAIAPAAFAASAPAGTSASGSVTTPAIAFQANTKTLWTSAGPGTGLNLGLGMRAGTSPAIACLAGGGYEAAFQANTGRLWVVHNGVGHSLGLGMMRGTSPAITALGALVTVRVRPRRPCVGTQCVPSPSAH